MSSSDRGSDDENEEPEDDGLQWRRDKIAAGKDPYEPEVQDERLLAEDGAYRKTVDFLVRHKGGLLGEPARIPWVEGVHEPRDAERELEALRDAVRAGDLDAVKYLLRLMKHADPVDPHDDSVGEPPLLTAVRCPPKPQQLRIISAIVDSRLVRLDRVYGGRWGNESAADILDAKVGGLAQMILYNPGPIAREIYPESTCMR